MPRPNWLQQIRESGAINHISQGRFDRLDLPALQAITNDYLLAAGPGSFPWRERQPVACRSAECDALLAGHMAGLEGELYVSEAALLACLHVLTGVQLRAQLEALHDIAADRDPTALTFFRLRFRLYLHCLEVALDQRPDVFARFSETESHEGVVVEQLLAVMDASTSGSRPDSADGFPLIWRLLWGMTRGGRRNVSQLEHLPDDTIAFALQRFRLGNMLQEKLGQLSRAYRWRHVRELVKGVGGVAHLPRARAILEKVLPKYAMWAAWEPDKERLKRWGRPAAAPHLRLLEPLFLLEGPDTTGSQRRTLLQASKSSPAEGCCELDGSSPVVPVVPVVPSSSTSLEPSYPWSPQEASNSWASTPLTPPVDPMSGMSVEERMLHYLDDAINVGPEAVNLFIYLFADLFRPESMDVEHRFTSALELRDDLSCRVLLNHLKATQNPADTPVAAAATSLAAALPIIGTRLRLQEYYGAKLRLRFRAPEVLKAAQREFCDLLLQDNTYGGRSVPGRDDDAGPAEAAGLAVQALGRAMLCAAWLREDWTGEFVDALRRMPATREQVKADFRQLEHCSDSGARRQRVHDLAYRLGASRLGGGGGGPPAASASMPDVSSMSSGISSPPQMASPPQTTIGLLAFNEVPFFVLPPSALPRPVLPPMTLPFRPSPAAGGRRPPPPPPSQPSRRPPPPVALRPPPSPPPPPPPPAEDVIMSEPLTGDRDRLRALIRAIPGVPASLTAACTRQARTEHDLVVRKLVDMLGTGLTDQVCVNLANYLAPQQQREGGGGVLLHECWRDLLLHAMRQLPAGLLDRNYKGLLLDTWNRWLDALPRLLGDRFLDDGAGGGVVGFTREAMERLSAKKTALHRSRSMNTLASGRTGRTSFVSVRSTP
ncbi:hypothetical protein GGTG_13051 [Gaeumannomyces tritici R3-111a-1]|uniref:Uncharacterized protein n=1 Tax=Gaeumannomyces tritici (strain R3-111a-1) TaxID=644352 RepID=J3PHS0_GAET3|nr:hypothetical protein GGTG_13051 [Gaeumannomyces tritici R3-111a-1]EJT69432.1 hypothetical protein GGTG_13051 [Gaeumannomyces tritici R3-111a-1]